MKEKISFVIPCYCSEKTLPSVVNEIDDTMNQGELQEKYRYEIILVNDASPDQTLSVIESLVKQKENVTGVHFSRNFGQHAALMAGFRYIAEDSDLVVCLDDDGQTPAAEVGKLLHKLEEGYDAVYAGYAHKRQSFFRNFGSAVNEKMTRIMLGKPKELQISSYFAVKRFLVDEMVRYEAAYPYVIGLLLRSTKNIANVPVNHRAREVGSSGYTMKKLLSLWFNGFTNFSINGDGGGAGAGRFSLWNLHDYQSTVPSVSRTNPDRMGLYHLHPGLYRRDVNADDRYGGRIHRAHLYDHECAAAVCGQRSDPEGYKGRSS